MIMMIMSKGVRITAYCDADWAGDKDDRKSTSGYCIFINNNLINWCSKKQSVVALSSAEAEYMAISEAIKELIWIRMIMKELMITVETPSILYVDNQSAIRISENDGEHERTKHIDVRHYFIKDTINQGEIKLKWISTNDQLADIFTKALSSKTFIKLRDKMMNNNNNDNNDELYEINFGGRNGH
jgi:ribonuclease HI